MNTQYVPRMRPERLVATGRIVLAASSLFAVWLDPAEPAKHSEIAYALLAAYLVYSGLVAVQVWRWEAASSRWRIATHAFDLLFFSLFIYFTDGPASPFVAYFVFALVCATVRWQWQGVLWTAAASLTAYMTMGVYFAEVLRDPSFDLNSFIIRAVYLAVVALLLGYLGSHELEIRRDMFRLAATPETVSAEMESIVRELLEYAATVLVAPRVVAAWQEGPEESNKAASPPPERLNLAAWQRGSTTWGREFGESNRLIAERLRDTHFICTDVQAAHPLVRYGTAGSLDQWEGRALSDDFIQRFNVRSIIALRVVGQRFEGRLFLLDKPNVTVDDLVLGEILVGVIAARLDNFYLTARLKQTAATEERVKLARDLHDGTLQSFTGIALRLKSARRLLETGGGPAAAAALEELQLVLAAEQRELRFFIQELEPPVASRFGLGVADTLAQKLGELVERMSREWELEVELHADGVSDAVTDPVARDVYHIVREALVNAARHGGASRVRVDIRGEAKTRLTISVSDNGRGFPFEGTYSAEALAKNNTGPRSVRERVSALAGSLQVKSSRSGARLDVILPLSGA